MSDEQPTIRYGPEVLRKIQEELGGDADQKEQPAHRNITLHREWTLGKPKSESSLAASTGSVTVTGIRLLLRRERYSYAYYGTITGEKKQLQYQTSDGQWHDVPEIVTVESPNSD